MRQLDSLSYKTGIHTDCLLVRVCEEIDYFVISCLIIKNCRCLCLVDVAQIGWVNHVKLLSILCMVYLLSYCFSLLRIVKLTSGIRAVQRRSGPSLAQNCALKCI